MKKETVTVIGVGYVGLPLACLLAAKKYKVYGLDTNKALVNKINKGISPFKDDLVSRSLAKIVPEYLKATQNPKVINKSDVVIVSVPTPVDKSYQPDFNPLVKATETIAKNLKLGQLIVIESTINPGVSEEIILPILEKQKFKVGKDFYLAHVPERINPGDPKRDVSNLPRNVGALTKKGLKKAVDFYENIIDAPINPMNSIKAAEATKTIENAFRDINIAFVNELAKSFDQLGIDVVEVIKGASSKFSFMPHWPSCGVGGHCIPVDPYYLIRKAEAVGFSHDFLKLARRINNNMPNYTVELLQDSLNELKLPIKNTPIGVLGISYKANIGDTRESPSFKIIEQLEKMEAKVMTFDPFVKKHSTEKSLKDILKKSTAILVATDHSEFVNMIDGDILKNNGVRLVIDGKNCLDKLNIEASGIQYKGIGR
ncbi:MAG: nucleotide sugar dehydrogenase [Patescibacteria group bacterium]|nr:nucleotide sugar dehydrogenase [Patescibacteria group bacterium]